MSVPIQEAQDAQVAQVARGPALHAEAVARGEVLREEAVTHAAKLHAALGLPDPPQSQGSPPYVSAPFVSAPPYPRRAEEAAPAEAEETPPGENDPPKG